MKHGRILRWMCLAMVWIASAQAQDQEPAAGSIDLRIFANEHSSCSDMKSKLINPAQRGTSAYVVAQEGSNVGIRQGRLWGIEDAKAKYFGRYIAFTNALKYVEAEAADLKSKGNLSGAADFHRVAQFQRGVVSADIERAGDKTLADLYTKHVLSKRPKADQLNDEDPSVKLLLNFKSIYIAHMQDQGYQWEGLEANLDEAVNLYDWAVVRMKRAMGLGATLDDRHTEQETQEYVLFNIELRNRFMVEHLADMSTHLATNASGIQVIWVTLGHLHVPSFVKKIKGNAALKKLLVGPPRVFECYTGREVISFE